MENPTLWIVQRNDGKIVQDYDTLEHAVNYAKHMTEYTKYGPWMIYACSMVECIDIERK